MKQIRLNEDELKFLKDKLHCMFLANPKGVSKSILKKLDKERVITRRTAKQKGMNLQKWVCQKLCDIIGIEYDQKNDDCEIRSREGGQHGADVVMRGSAAELLPFSIECKNSEQFGMQTTLEQVKANQKEGTEWVIVYKSSNMEQPVVIIDWNMFERYVKLNVLTK
jgi:hypothetical protein